MTSVLPPEHGLGQVDVERHEGILAAHHARFADRVLHSTSATKEGIEEVAGERPGPKPAASA